MSSEEPPVHDYPAHIPEPLYNTVSDISAITGNSVNLLIVQGLEKVVDDYNSTVLSSAETSNFVVPSSQVLRTQYAASPRWSTSRSKGLLTKWSSTTNKGEAEDNG